VDPVTRYARNGSVHLAYQVVGDGALDLVVVPAWINQIEHTWAYPPAEAFMRRLAGFSRLIMFDRRGTGLSDPMVEPLSLEEQADDVAAVMDAAGSERAALFASSEGSAMACLFAAAHPERVQALALYAPQARFAPAPGYEWPLGLDERAALVEQMTEHWGDGSSNLGALAPRSGSQPELREWFATLERLALPPGMLGVIHQIVAGTDVRSVLPSIRVPTLVMHRPADPAVDPRHAEYVSAHIPGAESVALPGDEALMLIDTEPLVDEIERFLTGTVRAPEPDRALATLLFTDLVGSTERAAAMGDGAWRELLGRHDDLVRRAVAAHRGRPIKSLGDGWLATFDGPARGVRCALELRGALAALGLEMRAGLHTGEVELLDRDVGGMAVHIAARVAAVAAPGEVVTSQTVRDLVVGSGLQFSEARAAELKGVPGSWAVHTVLDRGA
jgi:class 3 adenylate cyclase